MKESGNGQKTGFLKINNHPLTTEDTVTAHEIKAGIAAIRIRQGLKNILHLDS